ncbi:potassium-transporting ATPase subunit C [Elizabethkingia sp. HvH-WGS333]|uniref:potassium-transporting ATPase subunit C n=1 Tax=Elizabethkingia TaxID=308865 RepID=UPI0007416579|nr:MULTISPECIES: potassium-transporting ATPase subunit C [Elizabethkingia]KUG13055.1 potassium-transporting ATPase subunit C [Elizabethkingia miricola]MCL1656885.1 potassium-transporting ATPase subunit C [Elizabethkingia miricola]MCP1253126.1 potassium-transporting ATPase subunit C [Elizabethkingia sp. S0634]MDX8570555.1 potassium-transporting ATPase subunit C [Elizabethkingia sp. HX QKY]OIK44594.1 potassium-transporting ATPase subunit C [Elizabethkingia sp. HvH-WGS333]
MKNYILPAVKLTFVMAVLVGIYLMFVYAGSKVLPTGGNAEIITYKGQKFYRNIGQEFKSPKYFHGRPSSVNYKADGSGASNKGPSNKEYLDIVQKRLDTLKMENPGMENTKVPVELITASGSGLDPDISPEGALYQVKRIAKVRNLSEEEVKNLVTQNTTPPVFHLLGPAKVNVLELNLALDKLSTHQ